MHTDFRYDVCTRLITSPHEFHYDCQFLITSLCNIVMKLPLFLQLISDITYYRDFGSSYHENKDWNAFSVSRCAGLSWESKKSIMLG